MQLCFMSESTVQAMFHRFCECFARDVCAKWIHPPQGNDLEEVMGVYQAVGFPGAVGSTECTQLRWERAPISDLPLYW
ncbi:unnamed protein product [Discosporangium mesarthrocarpum]